MDNITSESHKNCCVQDKHEISHLKWHEIEYHESEEWETEEW